jgi:hypothetical protein
MGIGKGAIRAVVLAVAFGCLSSWGGKRHPATPDQSIPAFLEQTFAAGAPRLTLVSGAPVIAAVGGRTVRGDAWHLDHDRSCVLHESYIAGSELFRSTSSANHPTGAATTPATGWSRWAEKHGVFREQRITFFVRGLESVRMFSGTASTTETFQDCHIFAADPSAASMTFPLATLRTLVGRIEAEPDGDRAFTVPFTIMFSSLYRDVTISPATLTGQARVLLDQQTQKPGLLGYSIDQFAHEHEALVITYVPDER